MLSLIAVHGNGGGGFRFARAAPLYPADVRFHAPTLPGFAGVPADPALRTLAGYAERLGAMVAELPAPRVVVGTGIGGSIALELARRRPALLQGLILHAPVGADLRTRRFPRLMRLPGVAALGRNLFAARLLRPFWRRALFQQPPPDDYLAQFFAEYRRCAVFGQMFTLIDADWFESLPPLSTPTALLWGAKERVLGVDQLAAFQRLLPNHVLRIRPDWDHFPMIETPAAFVAETVALARQLITMTDAAPGAT